jgi:hypothetical protein
MYSTEQFTMGENEMRGTGIRQMTLEGRIYGRGVNRVRYLDLDCG